LVRYVLDRQPDNYHAMKGLGNALVNRKDYPAALQAAREMISRFGDVPEAYKWRARAYWAQGDPKETLAAIDGYHRALGVRISFELDDLKKEALKALATAPAR